jgi:hypothetical protein
MPVQLNLDPQQQLLATVLDADYAPRFSQISDAAGKQYAQVLSNQNDMATIITLEAQRLHDKQNSVDLAKTSQDRMIVLNQNYSERYAAYTKILLIIVFGLIVVISIKYIQTLFFLPDSITIILYIIAIGVTLIYCVNSIISILGRDSIYFNQLALSPPSNINNTSESGSTSNSGNLMADITANIGAQYCDTANKIYWNTDKQKCEADTNPIIIPKPTESFANIESFASSGFYSEPQFVVLEQTTPYEISEIGSYSMYDKKV